MSFRVTAVVCTLALLACGSTAWAARCSGIGVVGSGQGIVFCDDFDLYCASPSNPDGSCHTNNDPRDEAAFEAVWPQDGTCQTQFLPNADMDLVTSGSWKGYDPIWQGYCAIHRQNQDIVTLSSHVHDMTSEIQALDGSKDSVNGSGNVISSRGDDGAGYVDPLDGTNPLPDTLKGQFFLNTPGGLNAPHGGYANFASYLELYLDEDRAPVDFTLAFDVPFPQCIAENKNWPILRTTDDTVHNAFAFGMLPFMDSYPCDVETGRKPTMYRAVVYDGLNWVQLAAPAFDMPNGDDEMDLSDGWNQFYFSIGTDNIEVRVHNFKSQALFDGNGECVGFAGKCLGGSDHGAVCSVDGDCAPGPPMLDQNYFVARIPRQYKGPFNKIAMGIARGEDLTNPAGDVCYPSLSGNNVKWDEVVLWDGVLEVKIGQGACCLENLSCTPNVSQDECENTLGGVYQGDSVSCASVNCCPLPWPDTDGDGDVDQTDFAAFQLCLGETAPFSAACVCFNEDDTGGSQDLIDAADFAKFQACTTGPDLPMNLGSPPAGCTP